MRGASFDDELCAQMHQWALWREERGARWPALPATLSARCRAAFVGSPGRPSAMQRQVESAVREIESSIRSEERCVRSGYSVDLALVKPHGERLAIEVDGPSHFVGRSREPTAKTNSSGGSCASLGGIS